LLILGGFVSHTLRLLRRLPFRILLGLPLPLVFLFLLVVCLLPSYALDACFGFEVNTLLATWVGTVGLVLRAIGLVKKARLVAFAAAAFGFLGAMVGCWSCHFWFDIGRMSEVVLVE